MSVSFLNPVISSIPLLLHSFFCDVKTAFCQTYLLKAWFPNKGGDLQLRSKYRFQTGLADLSLCLLPKMSWSTNLVDRRFSKSKLQILYSNVDVKIGRTK